MLINENQVRKIVRKKIKEAINEVDGDGTSGEAAGEVDPTTIISNSGNDPSYAIHYESENVKNAHIIPIQKMIDDIGEGAVTITATQAKDYAKRLYTATKGGYDLGFGTDKKEIGLVLKAIPTCVDVSYVSSIFEKMYADSWTFHPTLNAVFAGELHDQAEMYDFVELPIEEKMKDAFIQIGDDPKNRMGKKQFFDMIKKAAPNLADAADYEGKERSGYMAISPILTYLGDQESSFGDGSANGFKTGGADALAALGDNGVAAIMAASTLKGVESNIIATASTAFKDELAAKKLAYQMAAETEQAAAKQVWKQQFARGAGDAAAKKVARGGGSKKAQKAARTKAVRLLLKNFDDAWNVTARNILTKSSSVGSKVATQAGVKTTGTAFSKSAGAQIFKKSAAGLAIRTVGRGALKFIPYAGWALLAYDLIDVATAGDIPASVDLALNSQLYVKMDEILTNAVPSLEVEVNRIKAIPVFTKQQKLAWQESENQRIADELDESSTETNEEIVFVQSPITQIGDNDRDNIGSIQDVIESYNTTYMQSAPIDSVKIASMVDGQWNSNMTSIWKEFIVHVFTVHTTFRNHSIAPRVINKTMFNWIEMSAQLKNSFQNYTNGYKGMLAFCIDAHAGNTSLGGSPGFQSVRNFEDPASKTKSQAAEKVRAKVGGTLTSKNFTISAQSENESRIRKLEDIKGVAEGTSAAIADKLVNSMKRNWGLDGSNGHNVSRSVTYNLIVKSGRDGKIKVSGKPGAKDSKKSFIGGGDITRFEAPYRDIAFILNSRFPEGPRQYLPLDLDITVPRGFYKAQTGTVERADEANQPVNERKIKSLIREQILKQISKKKI